jgi:hypothetical protein
MEARFISPERGVGGPQYEQAWVDPASAGKNGTVTFPATAVGRKRVRVQLQVLPRP